MKTKILGVSASPQKGGKVETLMREVLSSSRLPFEGVRLHELNIKPCKACNGCRGNNLCVIDYDWPELRNKIIESRALVIGGWAFSGMIDSATKVMMERFWSFRHHRQLTRGKVGAAVVVGNNGELSDSLADALLQFMRLISSLSVTSSNSGSIFGFSDSSSSIFVSRPS